MKHGIKFVIMSRLVALIVIILVAFAALLYYSFAIILQNSIVKRGNYEAQINLSQIERAVDEIYQLSETLSLNTEVRTFVKRTQYDSIAGRVVAITHVMQNLKKTSLLKKYIHSFCLVTLDDRSYWSVCPYDDFFINYFNEHALYGETSQSHLGFTNSYRLPVKASSSYTSDVISCVSNIYQIDQGMPVTIGQVIVNMDLTTLMADVMTPGSLFKQMAILNGNDEVIYQSAGAQDQLLRVAGKLQNDYAKIGRDYYFVNEMENSGWKVVSYLDSRQITVNLDFPFLLIVSGIIIMALCLVFIFIFPQLIRISKQIVDLDQAIGTVAKGNLDVSVNLTGPRELGYISQNFNTMVIKTKQSIQETLESQNARQKISFELLLAKINPHFIYNTLNSVIYLARKNQNQDVIELTSAFIFLLQDSIHLDENSVFTQVENELEVVDKYLIIQKYRYTDRFVFTSRCDESLREALIPKNILQPLIENAILHGVCPKEGLGHIDLTIVKMDDRMVITVTDDGVGMEQDLANQLLTLDLSKLALNKPAKMRPIGIRNIAEKLHFIYAAAGLFTIASQLGQGAVIRIEIPIRYVDETIGDEAARG